MLVFNIFLVKIKSDRFKNLLFSLKKAIRIVMRIEEKILNNFDRNTY